MTSRGKKALDALTEHYASTKPPDGWVGGTFTVPTNMFSTHSTAVAADTVDGHSHNLPPSMVSAGRGFDQHLERLVQSNVERLLSSVVKDLQESIKDLQDQINEIWEELNDE